MKKCKRPQNDIKKQRNAKKLSVSLEKRPLIWYNVFDENKPKKGKCFMAIITQKSLFDYTEIEELGDLERLDLAMEGIDDEKLMQKLETKRGKGRDDYPVRELWKLLIAMIVFCHKTVESFRRELSRNSQLRRMCGLYDYGSRYICCLTAVTTV